MNFQKILAINYLIDEHRPDIMIIWETWLSKDPTGINQEYETFRTINWRSKGVCITCKRGIAEKSFTNDEPYLMAIKLRQQDTYIIRVYMKEDIKQNILNQIVNLLKRIRRKHSNPNIILFGDCNTNQNWRIDMIEKVTNLKVPEDNKTWVIWSQKRTQQLSWNTLDYFLTNSSVTNFCWIEHSQSDHFPIKCNIRNWYKSTTRKCYTTHSNNISINNLKTLISSKLPDQNLSKDNFVKTKLTIRPIVKIQSTANSVFKDKTDWETKSNKIERPDKQ